MTETVSSLSLNLFYSYSHKDVRHKQAMEKTLASLQRRGFLRQWSDVQILPGQNLSQVIEDELAAADIVVFLLSPDFLDSEACLKEWEVSRNHLSSGNHVFHIPIILRPCSWKDFLADDDVKVLPTDGNPLSTYPDEDTAWLEVYEGIRLIVEALRKTFTPKPAFLAELSGTDFLSQASITLEELFVFPRLTRHTVTDSSQPFKMPPITTLTDLSSLPRTIIHGEDKAGKTALLRYTYLSLVNDNSPVLFLDLAALSGTKTGSSLQRAYEEQFTGDYALWIQQDRKTLLLDNLTASPALLAFIAEVQEDFTTIMIATSSDVFRSFFKDDTRLVEFQELEIEPLTSAQQEDLIRKRLSLLGSGVPVTDGFVDQVEDRVNSVIISNRIVPRFPFFVLSILQTYETFMPRNISITSYGHCYYVLIIASLIRAGISEADDAVNACFNFAEQLAFKTYDHRKEDSSKDFDFAAFKRGYNAKFLIKTSHINRLQDREYGILVPGGGFRNEYMYYFFLGKYLAANRNTAQLIVEELCDKSYLESNYLTLLFTIHHATDDKIIDDILLGTMSTLESVDVARLDRKETQRFRSIISGLPQSVLSSKSVEEERADKRNGRDEEEPDLEEGPDSEEEMSVSRFRIFRNNKIMGQVLRNRHGNLERQKIEEIVEVIGDSALKLVNMVLKDEEEIAKLALYISEKMPEANFAKVQRVLRMLSFIWTMSNMEAAVEAFNIPEIQSAVKKVVGKADTAAYDIMGYFSELDGAEELTEKEQKSLGDIQKKHKDEFVKRVVSLRTQEYMNNHRSSTRIEQAVCSLLKIKYEPRALASGRRAV